MKAIGPTTSELGSQAITNWKCMKTLKSHNSYKNRRNLQIKEIFFYTKQMYPTFVPFKVINGNNSFKNGLIKRIIIW
jgi:hypothetical protein